MGGEGDAARPPVERGVQQDAPAGNHPRLRGVRRRRQEALPPQPVLRRARGAGLRAPPRGRHHLAHAGLGQEPDHGLASQVDTRESSRRARADHHRPHRAGRADRGGVQGRRRGHLPRQERRRPHRHAQQGHALADLLADPQVRRQGERRRGRCHRLYRGGKAGAAARLQAQGRPVCVRRRVPPHTVGRAARGDGGHPARGPIRRLHRHAAAEGGQEEERRGLRPLHPHLQVQRGGRGRRGAGSALRGARHRPAPYLAEADRRVVRGQDQGTDRSGPRPTQAALGYVAQGALQRGSAGQDRRRHSLRHGYPPALDGRARQRHVGLGQHLPGLQALRDLCKDRVGGQMRHRDQLQALPDRHQRRNHRRGHDREAAPVRHLPDDAGRLVRRGARQGRQQGRGVRESGQEEIHRRAGDR